MSRKPTVTVVSPDPSEGEEDLSGESASEDGQPPAPVDEEAALAVVEPAVLSAETSPLAEAEEAAPAAMVEPAAGPAERNLAAAEPTPTAATAATAKQGDLVKGADVVEFEIECTKKRESETLGLKVIADRQPIVILDLVPGGMIARWNASNPAQPVTYGSVIYDINGVSSSFQDMMAEIQKNEIIKLKVRRHNRYTVTGQRKKMLGMQLKPGTTSVIGMMAPSLNNMDDISLSGWNTSCQSGFEIMAGDRVVEVNGQKGTDAELLRYITECTGEFSLTMARG